MKERAKQSESGISKAPFLKYSNTPHTAHAHTPQSWHSRSGLYPVNHALKTKQSILGFLEAFVCPSMSSFVPDQDEGVIAAPAPTGTFSGPKSDNPPVPWPAVVAMFKTLSELSPASAPLITQSTTLEQDKATVLGC